MLCTGKLHVATTAFLLAIGAQLASCGASTKSSVAASLSTSICPSRTINYITETLPQQCLRTDWSRDAASTKGKNASAPSVGEAGLITLDQPSLTPNLNTTQTESSLSSSTAKQSEPAVTNIEKHTTTSTVTESSTQTVSPTSTEDTDLEADPLSDNANFLSFEDWKAQMLQKAGQSAENIGGARHGDTNAETRRRSAGVQHALDSLGDDAEIELEFPSFVNSDSMPEAVPPANNGGTAGESHSAVRDVDTTAPPRSKEAGTTSKERFNYASFDCAATVLKTNDECKGPNSILLENKDSYMLNPCATKNKFFIVELCNDILIDTIALGNYEFFSSTFRTVRVSISDRYPVKADKWREIGVFEAQNTRGVQAFLVENGLIWARYLRIEFLTHYGNEYYCPVSILRVHGKTMIDDYRNDMKAARGEDDIDDETIEAESDKEGIKLEKITALPVEPSSTTVIVRETGKPHNSTEPVEGAWDQRRGPQEFKDKCPRTNFVSPLVQQVELVTSACASSRKYCNLELTSRINATAREISSSKRKAIPTKINEMRSGTDKKPTEDSTRHTAPQGAPGDQHNTQSKPSASPEQHQAGASSDSETVVHHSTNTTAIDNSATAHPSHASTKTATQVPAASPSTQESFFKSVHKRLQLLEANSTLSLQYIEEQSRILREAFTKVEKRQLNKTTTFLDSLNRTVLGELREFRLQYDQIWQSTILELSSQREQSQREAVALTARMTLLADEVLWQKRLVYLQFGLILLCLGLIMFSRNNSVPYLELPAIQNLVQRSSGFSRHLGFESPPGTPSRPSSRYGLFSRGVSHSRNLSNDTTKSPSTGYRSPTPPTDDEADVRNLESPEPAEPMIRRAVSSPALRHENNGDSESEDESSPMEAERHGGVDANSVGLDSRILQDEERHARHDVASVARTPSLRSLGDKVDSPRVVEKQARFAPATPD